MKRSFDRWPSAAPARDSVCRHCLESLVHCGMLSVTCCSCCCCTRAGDRPRTCSLLRRCFSLSLFLTFFAFELTKVADWLRASRCRIRFFFGFWWASEPAHVSLCKFFFFYCTFVWFPFLSSFFYWHRYVGLFLDPGKMVFRIG